MGGGGGPTELLWCKNVKLLKWGPTGNSSKKRNVTNRSLTDLLFSKKKLSYSNSGGDPNDLLDI